MLQERVHWHLLGITLFTKAQCVSKPECGMRFLVQPDLIKRIFVSAALGSAPAAAERLRRSKANPAAGLWPTLLHVTRSVVVDPELVMRY